ncbi:MAG TPA: transglutaminase-like domain-containing protein [Pyrinomonadaceae bacterium]|jgi:hypothetical protein
MTPRALPTILAALALALFAAGAGAALRQRGEDEYVRGAARRATTAAGARDFDSRVVALRDAVRAGVRNIDFPAAGRPFLRDTAADTLRSGRGRCGEAARAFINMARAEGIPAQRLYLEGRVYAHVVVVVTAPDGRRLIADPTYLYFFDDVEPLADLARHAEFTRHWTFGWRRLGALRALPSHFVPLGPLVYFFENPHALLACLCLLGSAAALTASELLGRGLPRRARGKSDAGFALPAPLEGRGA